MSITDVKVMTCGVRKSEKQQHNKIHNESSVTLYTTTEQLLHSKYIAANICFDYLKLPCAAFIFCTTSCIFYVTSVYFLYIGTAWQATKFAKLLLQQLQQPLQNKARKAFLSHFLRTSPLPPISPQSPLSSSPSPLSPSFCVLPHYG